ncbi:solute carrier family 15 member 4-like [Oscarella lobularis]|uniref:solute carrier family 15 member 4-like n=1 Tax=Oscarella lobularis TaxID=121494 RepID=UPI003313DE0F
MKKGSIDAEYDSDSEQLIQSARYASIGTRAAQRRRTLSRLSTSVSPAIARLLLLLLLQTLERAAWYIVSINVRRYTRYCMGVSIADIVSLLFVATTFLLSPLWGYACDRKLGHYKVLVVALIPYTIGGVFVYASSLFLAATKSEAKDRVNVAAKVFYFVGIGVVAVCGAAVRAVMLPYMLEQLAYNEHQRRRHLEAFVGWSYFAINIGGLVGEIYNGMLSPKFWSELIDLNHEPNYRREYGYVYILVPVCLFLVLSLLIISRKRLRHYKPDWKSFPKCSIICRTAWYKTPSAEDAPLPRQWRRGELARRDNAIKLGTIVPYVTSMLFFFVVQSQYATSFAEQTMRLKWPDNVGINATITRASFTGWWLIPAIIDPTSVVLTVPLMLYVIRPLYERCVKSPLSFQARMRLGMFLAGLACLAAAIVQWKAKRLIHYSTSTFYYHYTEPNCFSNLSVFYQVPQYLLIGVAEVLAFVGVMEFVLGRAPREYKTIAYSMLQMLYGVAYVLSFAVIEIVKKTQPSWYFGITRGPDDCQESPRPIWNYFILLAWFTIGSLAFFIFADIKYHGYTRRASYVGSRESFQE